MDGRTKDSMFLAISTIYNTLISKLLKTFTFDSGKEFTCYKQIEIEFGILIYFTDVYAVWKRGSNVNRKVYFEDFS